MIKEDTFRVAVGSDIFDVLAADNLSARYRAAELFKEKYSLKNSVTTIVQFAKARLVTAPVTEEATATVLEILRRQGKE